jgi:hypothetical protein
MLYGVNVVLILKYIVLVGIFVCLVLAPAYLACVNNSAKYDRMRVRVGSWLFGWSFVGWIFALFVSAKKS